MRLIAWTTTIRIAYAVFILFYFFMLVWKLTGTLMSVKKEFRNINLSFTRWYNFISVYGGAVYSFLFSFLHSSERIKVKFTGEKSLMCVCVVKYSRRCEWLRPSHRIESHSRIFPCSAPKTGNHFLRMKILKGFPSRNESFRIRDRFGRIFITPPPLSPPENHSWRLRSRVDVVTFCRAITGSCLPLYVI